MRAYLLPVLLLLTAGCRGCAKAPARAEALRVPHVTGPITLDGELEEVDWTRAARTGAFTDKAGDPARPFSEARFLWDESTLYLALYAADDDIRQGDAFSIKLSPEADPGKVFTLDITPTGAVKASWDSGIKVAVDRDGSLDDAGDDDEEWVIEGALPLRSLGLAGAPGARLRVAVSRCDTPRKTGDLRCGAWGDEARSRTIELGGR